jgi:transposase
MKHTVIGMDIAKHVFQLHGVDSTTGQIERKKLRRHEVLLFFAQHVPVLIAMEACGGAHWWARELTKLGHEVRLLPAKAVRPFVLRNKTDAADAQAIWTAVQQPGMKNVSIKSEHQQAILALHRMRSQLMKFRIMHSNAIRGLLQEFGQTLPESYHAMGKAMATAFAALEGKLPGILIDTLREQWTRVQATEKEIALIEQRLKHAQSQTPACQAIAAIPGVGVLTATAAVATMGDPATFKTGREFAAWLGLVPRQTGTGGRIRQLGISKRGDAYLRTLLMHGARSIIAKQQRSQWVAGLLARRPYSVAVAAIANKLARTIWAVLATNRPYQRAAFSAVVTLAPANTG